MSEPYPALKENETQWAGNLKNGKQWDFLLSCKQKQYFEYPEGKKVNEQPKDSMGLVVCEICLRAHEVKPGT